MWRFVPPMNTVGLAGSDGKDGLGWLLYAHQTVHDQEHDDGQQRREDGAQ